MLEIIKRLIKFNKKEKAPEEEPNLEYPSGKMLFTWDGASGDFNIMLDVHEVDDDSSDTLGLLLYHIDNGDLTTLFIKAIKYWAEENQGSEEYARKVLATWQASIELAQISSKEEELAIDPSQVFNLRQGFSEQ